MKGWITGWKNIAKYLNVSMRTAKKYCYEFSMPVRKIGEKGPVVSLPSEVDRWAIEFDRKMNGTRGYIYFIQADNGLIKIGFSGDPKRRLKGLKTMCPIGLELLAVFEGSTGEEEKLHERFKKHRVHGEWFKPRKIILKYINEINIIDNS